MEAAPGFEPGKSETIVRDSGGLRRREDARTMPTAARWATGRAMRAGASPTSNAGA